MVGQHPFHHTVASIPHCLVGQVRRASRNFAPLAGIQVTWIHLALPSMALDTRFPAGMTRFLASLPKSFLI
jgi:hypothetical protein